jgi:hypothetical protein
MPAVIWSGTSSIEASARFGGLFYCPAVGSTRKGERGAVVYDCTGLTTAAQGVGYAQAGRPGTPTREP